MEQTVLEKELLENELLASLNLQWCLLTNSKVKLVPFKEGTYGTARIAKAKSTLNKAIHVISELYEVPMSELKK